MMEDKRGRDLALYEYELQTASGKVLEWVGTDGVDACMRAADCTGETIVAWRNARYYVGPASPSQIDD